MSAEQQLIYECSRKTADKQISNSEWINIFRGGIQVNRGDTVRLLGSFISEDGDSSDIQILEDQSFTMEYTPYLNIDTVRFEDSVGGSKSHPAQYQMRFGDIGSPVYATDAFGIEPPYYALNGDPRQQNNNHNFADQLREPISDSFMEWYSSEGWFSNLITPEATSIDQDQGYDFAATDKAIKLGSYFDTNTGIPNAPTTITTNDSKAKTYPVPTPTEYTLSDFNLKNLEHQYQIAHLCKLVYFPVFQGIYVDDGAGNMSISRTFDDNDYLQVGDYISTYFVSKSSKQSASSSSYEWDGTKRFGEVQWNAGPRSVVGKILATKKTFVQVPNPLTGNTVSVEMQGVYIYEFVNPGSYKNENDESLFPRHGSALRKNGYNLHRNDNRNAGVSYQAYPKTSDENKDYPWRLNYMPREYAVQRVTAEVYAQDECPINDTTQEPNENMRLETNTSLSFLWTCRATDMRCIGPDGPSLEDGVQDKATSWIHDVTTLGTALPITVSGSFAIGSTIVDIYPPANKIRTESEIVFAAGNAKIKEIFNFPGYVRLITYAGVTEGKNVGEGITYLPNTGGVYWYPRQYKVTVENYSKNTGANQRSWKNDRVGITDYDNWGAITKLNPENDNVESYTPTGTNSHRLYIPFTEQSEAPTYRARHFGAGGAVRYDWTTQQYNLGGNAANYAQQPTGNPNNIQVRKRQNFGISCGRGESGDSRNAGVGAKPVPYVRTDVDGWAHEYSGGHGGAPTSFINQDQGNSYNDSVISIHIQQPLTGSQSFKQATTDNEITAKLWQEDLIYVKRYKTEFKPKPGYYNYQQVAEDLDRQLHMNHQDYKKNVGNNTTVGLRQRARGVAPNVINGNFIHTYLPDITYGFIPLTEELYNQDITNWNLNDINNFRTKYVNEFLKSNPYTNDVIDNSINDDSILLYFVPFNKTNLNVSLPEDESLQLFKLNGAKLIEISNTLSMDHQDPQAMMTNRSVDILNTMNLAESRIDLRNNIPGAQYQTRTAFNNFTYGGCAKCFVGAVNPSFEVDPDIQRMIFKFLYTPYRPATDDSGTALSLVSGQAVPSAIIDSFGNGGVTDSLSGIQIRDLVATQINQAYYPIDFLGFTNTTQYQTIDPQYVSKSTDLWNTLGFSNSQLADYQNNSETLPFTFWNREFILNDSLYNIAELDISVNASNPFYSYCSLWLPPLQYSVETDSTEVIASKQPLTQNSPFYLIGSDFPGKHYYGNKGTKLPVMGVCSRQFTSFGFAFDLSESAIQWTIEEDTFLTSIHTKIYNNDMTVPLNLDNNSSIIYAITKGQYYKEPSQEDLQNAEQLMLENTEPPIQYTPQNFIYPNQLTYEAPLFYDEDSDYDE